jgi:hypothetical protein
LLHRVIVTSSRSMKLVGAWHLVCAALAVVQLWPVGIRVLQHPVGLTTVLLIAYTGTVGVALLRGARTALDAAIVLQALQVIAVTVPGTFAWVVRVGVHAYLGVPPVNGMRLLNVDIDTAVFIVLGRAAGTDFGIAVNVLAITVMFTCLQLRGTVTGGRAEAIVQAPV